MTTVTAERQEFAIAILGGPTTVIDIGGRRLVVDPTFDPPGEQGYLTKLTGPAVSDAELGPVDAVLVSHEDHPDNLDTSGRAFALAAPILVAGPTHAGRLGPAAIPLAPWQTTQVGAVTVQAVPAEHGPADGDRDADGNINTEVIGFVLSGNGIPTVYVSGDNASIRVVTEIAERVGQVDVAVLFAGAASVPIKERGRPLTLTSHRAAAAAAVLNAPVVIPSHYTGWAHFSEPATNIPAAFDEAGLAGVLKMAPLGEWTTP
ncbi:MBL fold metallo-hydrolase [Actinocrispum wychmicini]|nr:MBL fold metallo-hydrolase [Actinocrispum wychmicini]